MSASTCNTPRQRKFDEFDSDKRHFESPLAKAVNSNESGISDFDFWLTDAPQIVAKK